MPRWCKSCGIPWNPCAPRPLRETLQQAQDFIAGTLTEAGYEVRFQDFQNGGTTYRNIIAERKGTRPGRYIIGAHYDACEPDDENGTNPGADDNASAVAALLALAKRMPEHPRHTVEMVFYACEEPPWFDTEGMGSHHHAMACNAAEVKGMICLEMLGYFSNEEGSQPSFFPCQSLLVPAKGNFLAVVGNLDSYTLARRAAGTSPNASAPCAPISPSQRIPSSISATTATTPPGYPLHHGDGHRHAPQRPLPRGHRHPGHAQLHQHGQDCGGPAGYHPRFEPLAARPRHSLDLRGRRV